MKQWEPDKRTQPDRVKRARPKQRAWSYWQRQARRLAAEHDLIADRVLDIFDHLADLYEWSGDERAAAEHRAWRDTTELLIGADESAAGAA